MSSSVKARLLGRVVVDHHDVLFLIRHHHIPVSSTSDVLVVFVLDALSRLRHTFISTNFPRGSLSAIDEVNGKLVELGAKRDADTLIVCWCTDTFVTRNAAVEQLDLLRSLQLGAVFGGLSLRDIYWVNPDHFVSLHDTSGSLGNDESSGNVN
jgi:hypothetical protein